MCLSNTIDKGNIVFRWGCKRRVRAKPLPTVTSSLSGTINLIVSYHPPPLPAALQPGLSTSSSPGFSRVRVRFVLSRKQPSTKWHLQPHQIHHIASLQCRQPRREVREEILKTVLMYKATMHHQLITLETRPLALRCRSVKRYDGIAVGFGCGT